MPAKPLQTRKQLAALISETLFPVTPRQLQTWPELTVHHLGRHALIDPDEALEAARKRLENAPVIKQGNFKMNGAEKPVAKFGKLINGGEHVAA